MEVYSDNSQSPNKKHHKHTRRTLVVHCVKSSTQQNVREAKENHHQSPPKTPTNLETHLQAPKITILKSKRDPYEMQHRREQTLKKIENSMYKCDKHKIYTPINFHVISSVSKTYKNMVPVSTHFLYVFLFLYLIFFLHRDSPFCKSTLLLLLVMSSHIYLIPFVSRSWIAFDN